MTSDPQRKPRKLLRLLALVGLAVTALVVFFGWDWIRFWTRFESLGRNAQGYSEYRHRETSVVFVRVPEQSLRLGSPEDDAERSEDEHPCDVRLSPFLIGKYEVTRAAWGRVMGSTPANQGTADDLPVEGVSWDSAQEFCRRAGCSLPTEAQWESACRGGSSKPFGGTGRIADMGWTRQDGGTFQPVGTKLANDFGIHDLHGNVMEWCRDDYEKDFALSPAGRGRDPLCATDSELKVIRGGCALLGPRAARSAERHHSRRSISGRAYGLRPVYFPVP